MSTSLSPKERFRRLFLLKNIDERFAKNGKPYLSLILGTPEGDFEGRFWDMDAKSLPGLVEGVTLVCVSWRADKIGSAEGAFSQPQNPR